MGSRNEKGAFQANPYYERIISQRTADPESLRGLGPATLAMLEVYEAAREAAGFRPPEEEPARDRRGAERVSIYLPASWEGNSGPHEATIADLSIGGCFILTAGPATVGEQVRISVLLPRAGWVTFGGEVTNYDESIGFGARFTALTPKEEEALGLLFSIVKKRNATREPAGPGPKFKT